MGVQRWAITNTDEWLERRKRYVTASVVGALFGCHPYSSSLRLYMEKSGVEFPPPAGAVLRRGQLLESSVAAAVAEQHPEWRLEKSNEFYFDDAARIAATPDFLIHGDPRGLGCLQTKTAAPSIFKRDWTETDPPFWITLQDLTESMLVGAAFGAVAVLVVDPFDLQCPIYEIPRHPQSEARILSSVKSFWDDVAAGREPGADYGMDRDIMALLAPKENPDVVLDLSGDNEIASGLIERADLKERMALDEARCKQIETMVMAKMRDAAVATLAPDFRVTWKTTHFKGYEVKPRDSRVLRIYDKRRDDEAA